MDLKGKMELVIVYRYGNVKFDKSCNNEEELNKFKEFLKEHSIDRILKIDYHDNKVV